MSMRLFYFGLEPLPERYTHQLCTQWMPAAFDKADKSVEVLTIAGKGASSEIVKGTVLDATGRGMYALSQVREFLEYIRAGAVRDGDVIFLQDFWTPGFEAVLYALQLYGIKVKIYSMLHAQSVDEYDFTWNMRSWMRPMELGLAACMDGLFVGSTVHREQLRAAGFECPIHVVGLPISMSHVYRQMDAFGAKRNNVVFTSRFDREKNIPFMCEVAERFLLNHPDWTWTLTTSAKTLRSNDIHCTEAVAALQQSGVGERVIIKTGITKEEYYNELSDSRIQFNSSLQDYVSWTMLEAAMAGCELVYPNFRSFPEILPASRLYTAFDVRSAVTLLHSIAEKEADEQQTWEHIAQKCDEGRLLEAKIIMGVYNPISEVNIWHNLK